MKFNPTNQLHSFEPISTPNKNIQSFFMKSEQSYLIPDTEKFQNMPTLEQPITFFFTNNIFVIEGKYVEQDVLVNDRFNIEKYGSIQGCVDKIYSIVNSSLSGRYKEKDQGGNQIEKFKIKETEVPEDSSINFIENEKVEYLHSISNNNPVLIIFNDFMCRSDIICLIDIVINYLGFKAVMLLPISLCLSFYFKLPYIGFVYKNGFSFVEDFCLVDSYEFATRMEKYLKIRPDDEDFAEDFSRLNLLSDSNIFSCLECGLKEDTEEKIKSHTMKEHQNESFYKYEKSDEFITCLNNRLRYLFKNDSYDKISKKIFNIDSDCNEYEKIDSFEEKAICGALVFSGLEISKEVWMTGYEWRTARIRILKEKLLFYI